jgi:serine phosphatase RsbU (regulator of sigma subunit)
MGMSKYVFIITFLFQLVFSKAQISISGFVMGFKGEKVMMLRKAQKNVSFDGTIGDAIVTLSGPNTNFTSKTNLSGAFTFYLKEKGDYKLSIRRNGYSGIDVAINYSDAGSKYRFESLYFLLKQEENSVKEMGVLSIDKRALSFSPNEKSGKDDIFLSNLHLLEKACIINNASAYASKIVPQQKEEVKSAIASADTLLPKQSETAYKKMITVPLGSNIKEMKLKLDEAKKVLSGMDTNSPEYKAMSEEIAALEQQLKDKQALVELQEKEISSSRKIITFLSLFLAAITVLALMLYHFFRQKKQYAATLKDKNEKISRINSKLLSSIRYASLIQNGFLQDKSEFNKVFRDGFIFNRPKDILSGDFYWFSQTNGHTVIAVADCTGHGVPGAMLTVLGHNALHEIVNVKGEVIPSKILRALNKVINETFSNNSENLEYGMDITIVSMKEGSDEFMLSGLANGLYHIKDGKVMHYNVSPKSFGLEVKDSDIADQVIRLEKNDCFFMFSDGYQDQFRGRSESVEKFNLGRFESLLQEISKKENLKDAEKHLETELQKWKEDSDQIDDILVVGFRV